MPECPGGLCSVWERAVLVGAKLSQLQPRSQQGWSLSALLSGAPRAWPGVGQRVWSLLFFFINTLVLVSALGMPPQSREVTRNRRSLGHGGKASAGRTSWELRDMELLVLPNMALWGCAVHGGCRDSPKSLLLASMVALWVGIQAGAGMKSPSGCSSVRKAGSVAGTGVLG